MNKNRFRSKMVLYGDTIETLATALGKSRAAVSAKINENGSEFSRAEMEAIRDRYNLTPDEFVSIFFDTSVS